MPTRTIPDRATPAPSRWLRRCGLILLAGWVAFVSWFVLADLASEGLAKEPVLLLAALWTASGTALVAPRLGSLFLFAFAAAAAWIFRAPAGVAMLVAPAVVSGVLLTVSAPRRTVATGLLLLFTSVLAPLGSCRTTPAPASEPPFLHQSITRHLDDRIEKGLLTAPATIEGVPCKGWIRFWPNGRLRSAELATAAAVQGHDLPAASYLWFDELGRLATCFLAQDTVLQGHLCRGGPFQIATSFHGNGALDAFFPREEVTIHGVRCASTTQAPVRLHPDGTLAGCRLAQDALVFGQPRRRGDSIELDATGRLLPAR